MNTFFIILFHLISDLNANTPIRVNVEAGIDFGQVISGSGSITIPPGNNPSSPSARFEVSGERRTAYTMILPETVNMTHQSNSSQIITLRDFTTNPEKSDGFIGNNGRQRIYVGATIDIPINIVSGEYKGFIELEVVYH